MDNQNLDLDTMIRQTTSIGGIVVQFSQLEGQGDVLQCKASVVIGPNTYRAQTMRPDLTPSEMAAKAIEDALRVALKS